MSLTLADLQAGQTGTIVGFSQDDQTTQRLMQLGVLEGEQVEVVRWAPAGDPLEIRILGYSLSLRGAEARSVHVELASA